MNWPFSGSSRNGPRREKSALDILKDRYACANIDVEEFEQKKRELG
jgi:uncharacterized membrane protein